MIRLKELRLAAGYSQQALAKKLQVVRSTIAMWETGGSNPDNVMLQKIADTFNVSVDYLLGREEQKKDPATEYSDEAKKIYELLSQLNLENQEKLLELAIMYVENQNKNKGKK